MSQLILVIARTGEGKTSLVKKMTRDKNLLVFDVNNEWDLPEDINGKRARYIGFDDTFLQISRQKKNTNIVFEEATGFLEGKISEDMRRLIISKRHVNCNLIFIFHSISSVPPKIAQMCDIAIIFKTGDELKDVHRKYSRFEAAFVTVSKLPTIPKNPNGPTIQPHVILYNKTGEIKIAR